MRLLALLLLSSLAGPAWAASDLCSELKDAEASLANVGYEIALHPLNLKRAVAELPVQPPGQSSIAESFVRRDLATETTNAENLSLAAAAALASIRRAKIYGHCR